MNASCFLFHNQNVVGSGNSIMIENGIVFYLLLVWLNADLQEKNGLFLL